MAKLSIIIPVYFNEDTLELLYEDLKNKVLHKLEEYEIVFVDDGSGDNSWDKIKKIALIDPNVVTLRLHFIGAFSETWKQWCTITAPQYLPDTDGEFTDFGITSIYGRHMLLRINSDGRVRTGYGGNINASSYQTITFLKK